MLCAVGPAGTGRCDRSWTRICHLLPRVPLPALRHVERSPAQTTLPPEVAVGRAPRGPGLPPARGACSLSPPSPLPTGCVCCSWCAPPRPGSCGASSTPSCGTGASTGASRAPSAECPPRPGWQPGSSRGSRVSAGSVWGGWGPPRAPDRACHCPSPIPPPPRPRAPRLLPGPDWHMAGPTRLVGGAGRRGGGPRGWVGSSGWKHVRRVASGAPLRAADALWVLTCPPAPHLGLAVSQDAGSASLFRGDLRGHSARGAAFGRQPLLLWPPPGPGALAASPALSVQPGGRLHQALFPESPASLQVWPARQGRVRGCV